jgi:acetyl esterase
MTAFDPSRADRPDPDVQSFLATYDALDAPELHELSPAGARSLFEQFASLSAGIDLPTVTDRTIEGPAGEIPVRIYDPRETVETPAPLVVFFHGGGFAVGSLDTHDAPCRKLASETGYPVLSVDYRLAPEHPFPAAVRDCYAAVEWAAANATDLTADPDRLVVAGDSAGGNLAAVTALLARDRDGPGIAHQVLVYPVTGDAAATPAYEENAEGYFLTAAESEWFRELYLPDDIDEGNVYARPRLCRDLSGLPPATVLTAGFDPLRDDGAAYAEALAADGVPVTYHNFDGLIHGFLNMIAEPAALDGAEAAYDLLASSLSGLSAA